MRPSTLSASCLLAVCAVTLPAQRPRGEILPVPKAITKRVWMLETPAGPDLGSNIAWVDRGDHLLVVDAAMPRVAAHATAWIAKHLAKPVRYLVLSHDHLDHCHGSGAFAGAQIIAHEKTKEILSRPAVQAHYRRRAAESAHYRQFPLRLPHLSLSRRLVLDDAEPRVEILHYGPGHSAGDLLVWIPTEGVLIGGDLLVHSSGADLGGGDLYNWIDLLERLKGLAPKHVLPGHGPAQGPASIDRQQDYLRRLVGTVELGIVKGSPLAVLGKGYTGSVRHLQQVYEQLQRRRLASIPANRRGGRVAVGMGQGLRKLRFLLSRPRPKLAARLRQLAPNVELLVARNRVEALQLADRVQGAVAHLCDDAFLARAKDLVWVQSMSAGVERYLRRAGIRERQDLVLTNMKGMHGPAIADHVFAMALHLARGLDRFRAAMAEGRWARNAVGRVPELAGKRLLVVGLGGIGLEVARRGKGFGMEVLGTRRSMRPRPEGVDQVGTAADLDRFLAVADLVVLCVPLTKDTRGMFDAARFAKLKRGAILINIARGKVVDSDALVAALRTGQVRAAGLDVTDPEPLPAAHPLWQMPQVIITPHVAGRTDGTQARVEGLLLLNLQRFGRGLPLLNCVDKKSGY